MLNLLLLAFCLLIIIPIPFNHMVDSYRHLYGKKRDAIKSKQAEKVRLIISTLICFTLFIIMVYDIYRLIFLWSLNH